MASESEVGDRATGAVCSVAYFLPKVGRGGKKKYVPLSFIPFYVPPSSVIIIIHSFTIINNNPF